MIWVMLGIGVATSVNATWLACLTYLFHRAKGRLDNQYDQMRNDYHRALISQEQLSDRLLAPPGSMSGEVREIIRTRAKPQESGAWREITEAAKRGLNCNIGASGRRFVIAEVDTFLKKLDDVAVAARIHLDNQTDPSATAKILNGRLEAVGLIRSREVNE